ncbi:MAG: phosphoribosyltransferase family protein [Phycisphaerales bacterium]
MYLDRFDAGDAVAAALQEVGLNDPVVLGLPRGGVVVAERVADVLGAPLDVVVAKKLTWPERPELAIGAAANGGTPTLVVDASVEPLVGREWLHDEAARCWEEVHRRELAYRHGRPGVDLEGRDAVIIDDGIATGWTMLAAVRSVRGRGAARVIVGVPVGSPESVRDLEREVDGVVCPRRPRDFYAVGQFYCAFGQVSDEQVVASLERARAVVG